MMLQPFQHFAQVTGWLSYMIVAKLNDAMLLGPSSTTLHHLSQLSPVRQEGSEVGTVRLPEAQDEDQQDHKQL